MGFNATAVMRFNTLGVMKHSRQPGDGEMAETNTETDPEGLDEFLAAYVEAALWSSTDDEGEPLDRNHDESDLAPETLARMRADCIEFLNHRLGSRLIAVADRLEAEGRWSLPARADCSVMAYAGHDLWLTRNGHGCGYFDGEWPRGIGEGLDKLSKRLGTFDLYLGDDGLIHGA